MACACLQGTAAYSNYGHKSNEELILGYGFMLEDNPADFFHISLGLVTQTEHGEDPFAGDFYKRALRLPRRPVERSPQGTPHGVVVDVHDHETNARHIAAYYIPPS